MDGTNTSMSMGGMGTWLIILLLFLFLIGGNGIGGFGGGNNAAAFMAGAASQQPNGFTDQLIANNTMWSNQLFNQQSIANLTAQMTTGFCNANSNIERAILAGQQNTASIIAASTQNVQRVLDKLCEQETQRLRAELETARLEANNAAQTATLISTLRPYPVPTIPSSSTTGS